MMRSALQYAFIPFVFILLFEVIATTSQSTDVRPKSYLAPLSVTKLDETYVFSDELGTNSDIYRGQPVRVAAFGTSFTMGVDTSRNQNWTRQLQNARPQVHIQNFSMVGGWEAFLANIEKAKSAGVKYDYVLISLTLAKRIRLDSTYPAARLFVHSSRFQNSDGFPTSIRVLRQLLSFDTSLEKLILRFRSLVPLEFANAQGEQVQNQGLRNSTIPLSRAREVTECYALQISRLRCRDQFEIAIQTRGLQYNEAYEDVFLVCQAEADKLCGVPSRIDLLPPFEVDQTPQYRRQIEFLLNATKQLGRHQVIISQALMPWSESADYRMLVKDNSVSFGFIYESNRAIALSNKAAWERASIRNDEIREAAAYLASKGAHYKFLDFGGFVRSRSNVESLFYDNAHLSPEGHKEYSQFIIQQLGL